MNLKRMIYVNIIISFVLAFLCHSLYNWFPNFVFSIIFPVNESIWEHMKMLYTTILLNGIFEFLLYKIFDIKHNNLLLITYFKGIIAIPIYLLLFLPIYYFIGENMFIAITIMLITIILVNLIGYKLLELPEIKYQKLISIILIIITYIIMGILTYNPPHTKLFLDTHKEKYGINDYLKK